MADDRDHDLILGLYPVREANRTPVLNLEVSQGLDLDLDLRVVRKSASRGRKSRSLSKDAKDKRRSRSSSGSKDNFEIRKKKTVFRKNGTIDLIKTVLTVILKMIRAKRKKSVSKSPTTTK